MPAIAGVVIAVLLLVALLVAFLLGSTRQQNLIRRCLIRFLRFGLVPFPV